MKSSTGQYFLGLDHVRALAAFMVFAWHFIHVNDNHLAAAAPPPLSLLSEGHTGVALFMTLSGYLFAKLLDGRQINYLSFLWNRILRLIPLLALVLLVVGVRDYFGDGRYLEYAKRVASGVLLPKLPNGGWSITVEFHFYLVLPLLLFFTNRWLWVLFVFVGLAILLRVLLHQLTGEVQYLAYWTIVGRIDQFVLGVAAFQYRSLIKAKHVSVIVTAAAFALFYWYFESLGGFYEIGGYPSPSLLWVVMGTLEGLCYGVLISWYDNSFEHSRGRISKFVALIGTYSYSIYLLHFFVVFELGRFIDRYLFDLSNVYISLCCAAITFFLMVPMGYLSYRFIEEPFLRFRSRYIQ